MEQRRRTRSEASKPQLPTSDPRQTPIPGEPFGKPNGLYCEVCKGPQFDTDGGPSCSQGHGGANGLTRAEVDALPKVDTSVGPNIFSTQDRGEKVAVTWGEEMIRIADFTNCHVGPFYGETTVREGETRLDAMRRLRDELAQLAEEERRRKVQSFMKFLKPNG